VSLDVLLTIANALTPWRVPGICTQPCCFRCNRTPWPPSSCARLPRQDFRLPEPFTAKIADSGKANSPHGPESAWASLLIRRTGKPGSGQCESSIAMRCGMRIHPIRMAWIAPPDRLPSCAGTPWSLVKPGTAEPFDYRSTCERKLRSHERLY